MEKSIREFRIGRGRVSGLLSAVLSTLCLGGVFCFYFPEYLTTPELRQVYPIEFLRRALAFFIGLSFLLGLFGFLRSSDKKMSLWGLAVSTICVFLGGLAIPVQDSVEKSHYLGLDWFILDILIVALVFIPIESLFYRVKQKIFRPRWKTDFYHFFFSHILIQLTSFLILFPSLYLGAQIANPTLQAWVQSQPLFVQFLEVLFLADFTQYWVHRAFHQIPFLWRFHAIHHSVQDMDWLAGSRLHLVDIVITRGLTLVPLFILGFRQEALQAYLVFVAFWATFIHVNIRYPFTTLQTFFATPIYHHWHHAIEKEAIDKNFAVHLPVIDRVFGTHYLPEGHWPSGYGIHKSDVPDSYLEQTLYPFRSKKRVEAESSTSTPLLKNRD
ncbi:MAG: sterol desaturase family protein [Bdellovibrionaceae bacterium]|nr:sterol desaturase family protein [Pseudobdellovibrionaceae bacterium]